VVDGKTLLSQQLRYSPITQSAFMSVKYAFYRMLSFLIHQLSGCDIDNNESYSWPFEHAEVKALGDVLALILEWLALVGFFFGLN
jgi:hypothetical protein